MTFIRMTASAAFATCLLVVAAEQTLPSPIWSGPYGDSTGYNSGTQLFPDFPRGTLLYADNISGTFAQCGVVILGDGSVVGSLSGSPTTFPAIRSVSFPPQESTGWTLSLSSAIYMGASVTELNICGSDVLVATIEAVSADLPPTWYWQGLVAFDVSGGGSDPPPGPLWFLNITTAITFPPSTYNSFGCNASVIVLAGDTGVMLVNIATGAIVDRVLGLFGHYVDCYIAVTDGVMVCIDNSDSQSTGGVLGLSLAPTPHVAWTAAERGWRIGNSGSPGHPAFSNSVLSG
jgi:hypothetical protein